MPTWNLRTQFQSLQAASLKLPAELSASLREGATRLAMMGDQSQSKRGDIGFKLDDVAKELMHDRGIQFLADRQDLLDDPGEMVLGSRIDDSFREDPGGKWILNRVVGTEQQALDMDVSGAVTLIQLV